ncbi:hypothetical protein AB0L82_35165 [Nocardia sp. NPDC052001]|uniref:hypothetical protein n=1 Tax=Nocardia sp. NPDC052001 TaxID=3154853 RepID=UPI003424B7A3
MSSTGNLSDTGIEIETRERTFHLHHHPGVLYSVVLVRPLGAEAEAWALAELTIRSEGTPIRQTDLPPIERLIRAAAHGDPAVRTPETATKDLDFIPMQYRRALHLCGVNTVAELRQLTPEQLRDVRGVGVRGARKIDTALAEFTADHPIDLDAVDLS